MPSSGRIGAFAVLAPGAHVVAWSYEPIALLDTQVELSILACGVCHSDLHQQHNDWGHAHYPLVVGHEIIGVVSRIGPSVVGIRVGDRVGVGPQTGSCTECPQCLSKCEQLCSRKVKSYNSPTGDPLQPYTYGGFAQRILVDYKWAIPIPDAMSTETAAPLLCAGITTWTPLIEGKVGNGTRLGILGLGGLGHIAIQFGAKLGAEVTAISTSSNKKQEAFSLGATAFLNMSDKDAASAVAGSFDFLLSTISADDVDWNQYLCLLRPHGTLCMVGLPSKHMRIPALPLVTKAIKLVGSYLAPRYMIDDMMQFAAKHNIQAMVEVLPMNAANCNLALAKIADNSARYRIVLVCEQP